MTLEEMLKLHQNLWNWLADEAEKGFIRTKPDYFELNSSLEVPTCACYACEYAFQEMTKRKYAYRQAGTIARCRYCPFDWSDETDHMLDLFCEADDSPYEKWLRSTDAKSAAKYARQIANMKPR